VIITAGDPIVATAAAGDWPMINAEHKGKTLPRPDILEIT